MRRALSASMARRLLRLRAPLAGIYVLERGPRVEAIVDDVSASA